MNKTPNIATDNRDGHKTPERTPKTNASSVKEIKDFLSSPLPVHRHSPSPEARLTPLAETKVALMKDNTLRYLNELEERCSRLEYTLLGVMHSVDKWLDVEPYDFDKDDGTVAATRASNAREIALKAIEKAQADLAQVERERCAAVRAISDAQHYIKNLGAVQYGLQQLEKWDYCIKKRGVCEENTKEDGTNAC